MGGTMAYSPQGGISPTPAPENLEAMTRDLGKEYPAIGGLNLLVTRRANLQHPERIVESFPAWEEDNPYRGRHAITINRPDLRGNKLAQTVGADAVDILTSEGPQGPVHPQLFQLANEFHRSFTPQQEQMNQRAYQEAKQQYGETRPYEQFKRAVRTSAYLRAGLFPEANPGWDISTFSPQQQKIIQRAQQALRQPIPR